MSTHHIEFLLSGKVFGGRETFQQAISARGSIPRFISIATGATFTLSMGPLGSRAAFIIAKRYRQNTVYCQAWSSLRRSTCIFGQDSRHTLPSVGALDGRSSRPSLPRDMSDVFNFKGTPL
jgi:hypothetical protein